jgi:hypothetical protein
LATCAYISQSTSSIRTAVLAESDELCRRQQTALLVAPAQQGLVADHTTIAQTHDRLVVRRRSRRC